MTTNDRDRPLDSNEVVIADSGVLPLKAPFVVSETDAEDIDLTELQSESFPLGADEEEEEGEGEDTDQEYDGEEEPIEGPIGKEEEREYEGDHDEL